MDNVGKYHGKTIMILGAGQLQVPIIQKAKSKGLKVVVVTPGKDEPGVKFADAIVPLDVKDEEGILEAAREYEIDGITTDQTDLPVRTAAYVADNLGLPSIGYELSKLFTDKALMRQKSSEIGVYCPKFRLVRSLDEAEHFYDRVGGIMVLKPIDSQASHGVARISCRDDIALYFEDAAKYSRNGQVIIEEWIHGSEFSVDSYVKNDTVEILAIGEYHPFDIEGAFSSRETIFPAEQPESVIRAITATNKRIINGFGLHDGRTHAEYIVDGNRCYLVEIAARGGGAYFSSHNVRYVSGFCTEQYLIDQALGLSQEPEWEQRECFCCCTLFFYLPEQGIVVSLDGVKEILNCEFVKINNLYQIDLGMRTKPIVDKGTRYFMVVQADSYDRLHERIRFIRSSLRIKTRLDDGSEKTPIWF